MAKNKTPANKGTHITIADEVESIQLDETISEEVTEEVTEEVEPVVESKVKLEVSHNASLIEWPTDIWGLTKNLKQEFILAASRINGQADKKELLDSVLEIANAHLEAKFQQDSISRAAKIAKALVESGADETPVDEQPTLF